MVYAMYLNLFSVNFAKLNDAIMKAVKDQLNTNEKIMVWTKINNLE